MPARYNLISNPSFEINTTGWTSVRGTIGRVGGSAFSGTSFCRFTADGTAGGNYLYATPYPRVEPGQVVTLSCYMRGAAGAGSLSIDLIWLNDAGTVVASDLGVPLASTGSWQRLSNTKTVPATATQVQCRVLGRSGTLPVGMIFEVDAFLLEVTDQLLDYFDGSSSLAGARCSFLGADHASISRAVTANNNPANDLRLEVAFTTPPDSSSPTWQDLTRRLDLRSNTDVKRGRSDEFSIIQPSTCSLTLDNLDGALTAGNASSPFYPNVLPMKKMRLSYRDSDVAGNFLSANQASMETSVADWFSNNVFGTKTTASFASNALATRVWDGAKSCRIDWPATAIGSAVMTSVTGLTIGRTYTASAYVYVPTGDVDVRMEVVFVANGSLTSVKDQFVRISVTWVATSNAHTIGISVPTAAAGDICYFDAVQVDEGSAPAMFVTAAPPISYRFTGYVEEWPTDWPGGGNYAQAQITATDRLARIGSSRLMRSVIEEAILATSPYIYYPLGEAEGVALAGEVSGTTGTTPLPIAQYGAPGAGTLTFGTATGPPTDGMPAPTFSPVSISSGKYLAGLVPNTGGAGVLGGFVGGVSLRACFLTSVANFQTIARIVDYYGFFLDIGIDTSGRVVMTEASPWDGTRINIVSPLSYADGNTHDVVVTLAASGAARLYVDGVQVATTSPWAGGFFPAYVKVSIGGTNGGLIFSGAISHVAAWSRLLTAAEVLEIATATTTGFEGESSNARIARYATWGGVPAGELNFDAGSSTSICFTETTGQSVTSAMQDVAQTEGGRLFVNGAGQLTFHARSRSYANPAARVSLAADQLGPDVKFTMSTQDLANDISGKRPTGPVSRSVDSASISNYGRRDESLTLLVTADTEVMDAVTWRLGKRSQPTVRLPSATLDLFASDVTQLDLLALELGDRVTVASLPAQAPATALDFIIEGYTESISLSGWSMTANLSNYADVQALILDDAVYGLLDSNNRLIY